jgi:D-alanyl-D-alanine carboxypeptidase
VGSNIQAAEALSTYSASSRDRFINEMNSKCMQLGIMDTQFDNPGGRFSQGQYATAKDLAVITQAAIRYQKIKDALLSSDRNLRLANNKAQDLTIKKLTRNAPSLREKFEEASGKKE